MAKKAWTKKDQKKALRMGWLFVNETGEIQKYDECMSPIPFKSDLEALGYVVIKASAGDKTCRKAIRLSRYLLS